MSGSRQAVNPPGAEIEVSLSYLRSATADLTLLPAKERPKARLLEVMVSGQRIADAVVFHNDK